MGFSSLLALHAEIFPASRRRVDVRVRFVSINNSLDAYALSLARQKDGDELLFSGEVFAKLCELPNDQQQASGPTTSL